MSDADDRAMWEDIATVTVPARATRKTVFEKAAQQAGLTEPCELRALDARSARAQRIDFEPQQPRLVIT